MFIMSQRGIFVRAASTYVENTVNKIYFNAAVIALPSKQVDRRTRPL